MRSPIRFDVDDGREAMASFAFDRHLEQPSDAQIDFGIVFPLRGRMRGTTTLSRRNESRADHPGHAGRRCNLSDRSAQSNPAKATDIVPGLRSHRICRGQNQTATPLRQLHEIPWLGGGALNAWRNSCTASGGLKKTIASTANARIPADIRGIDRERFQNSRQSP